MLWPATHHSRELLSEEEPTREPNESPTVDPTAEPDLDVLTWVPAGRSSPIEMDLEATIIQARQYLKDNQ